MAGADIEFRFESPTDEAQFVRDYLPAAWTRFETSKYWETGWFWAYRQFETYDSGSDIGLIQLIFEGDPDALIENEEEYWEQCNGLTSWRLRRYEELEPGYESLLEQQQDAKGAVAGEWEYHLKTLATQLSLAYLRAFDEPLPIVGEETDENRAGVGFWAVIHYLMIQCGYDWYDETAACLKGMKNRVKSLASYEGAAAAREEYAHLLAEWEAYGDELETWLAEHPTGEETVL